jgi:hypothetical protein
MRRSFIHMKNKIAKKKFVRFDEIFSCNAYGSVAKL